MFREDLGCYTSIVSKGRPFQVNPMKELVGEATWYVPKAEVKAYEEQGATVKISPRGLSNTRNTVLKDSFENNQYCLMLDDDLIKWDLLLPKYKTKPLTFLEAYQRTYETLKSSPFKLAGLNENNLLYFNYRIPISLKSQLTTAMMLIKPSEPKFDRHLPVGEDAEFTLQHIIKYGAAIKMNTIKLYHYGTHFDPETRKFQRKRGNEGGITYNLEQHLEAKKYLFKKWGNVIKPKKNGIDILYNF